MSSGVEYQSRYTAKRRVSNKWFQVHLTKEQIIKDISGLGGMTPEVADKVALKLTVHYHWLSGYRRVKVVRKGKRDTSWIALQALEPGYYMIAGTSKMTRKARRRLFHNMQHRLYLHGILLRDKYSFRCTDKGLLLNKTGPSVIVTDGTFRGLPIPPIVPIKESDGLTTEPQSDGATDQTPVGETGQTTAQ